MSSLSEIDQTVMWLGELFLVCLGLVVGSFLNVCILRVPHEESIIFPRSHCPNCGNPVRAYDNIPLLSFILLRGKCRSCGTRISWQYPVVELLTALIFWATFVRLGFGLKAVILLIFFSALIVLIFIDLYERILPNEITLPGILLGILFSLLAPVHDELTEMIMSLVGLRPSSAALVSFLNSFLAALACWGFLWFVREAHFRIRKIEGLGFGDIKLMAMVGAFLGMKLALLTIFLGSFLGAVIGLFYILLFRKGARYELPFGSFLGIAAIIAALWGHQLIGNYTQAIRPF